MQCDACSMPESIIIWPKKYLCPSNSTCFGLSPFQTCASSSGPLHLLFTLLFLLKLVWLQTFTCAKETRQLTIIAIGRNQTTSNLYRHNMWISPVCALIVVCPVLVETWKGQNLPFWHFWYVALKPFNQVSIIILNPRIIVFFNKSCL